MVWNEDYCRSSADDERRNHQVLDFGRLIDFMIDVTYKIIA